MQQPSDKLAALGKPPRTAPMVAPVEMVAQGVKAELAAVEQLHFLPRQAQPYLQATYRWLRSALAARADLVDKGEEVAMAKREEMAGTAELVRRESF